MCGGSPKVEPYVAPPKREDPAVQEAIRKERDLNAKRKGRRSTILTNAQDMIGNSGGKTMLGS